MNQHEHILIHNGTEYQVDAQRLCETSPKALHLFSKGSPLIINDMFPEPIFAAFIDAVHSRRLNLSPNIAKPLTDLVFEWQSQFAFSEIERQTIMRQDPDLIIAFILCGPNLYPQLFSIVAQNPREFAQRCPQFFNLPVSVIGSFFFSNVEIQVPSKLDIQQRFLSIKEAHIKANSAPNATQEETEKLKNEIAALKQKNLDLEINASRIRNNTNALQKKVPQLKEQANKKLSQIQEILSEFGAELKQLTGLKQEISDLEQQKKELHAQKIMIERDTAEMKNHRKK